MSSCELLGVPWVNKLHLHLHFALFEFFVRMFVCQKTELSRFLLKLKCTNELSFDHCSLNLEHNSLTSFGGLVNLINLKVIEIVLIKSTCTCAFGYLPTFKSQRQLISQIMFQHKLNIFILNQCD